MAVPQPTAGWRDRGRVPPLAVHGPERPRPRGRPAMNRAHVTPVGRELQRRRSGTNPCSRSVSTQTSGNSRVISSARQPTRPHRACKHVAGRMDVPGPMVACKGSRRGRSVRPQPRRARPRLRTYPVRCRLSRPSADRGRLSPRDCGPPRRRAFRPSGAWPCRPLRRPLHPRRTGDPACKRTARPPGRSRSRLNPRPSIPMPSRRCSQLSASFRGKKFAMDPWSMTVP